MKQPLLCLLLLFSVPAAAQVYTVSGKVTNNKLEPLAFASVRVQELQRGATTKEDGSYELRLEEGRYTLIISIIGYKPRTVTVAVTKDLVQNALLEEADDRLAEVTVSGKRRDPSEEIIRNVIRRKEQTVAAAGAYSCLLYIKATQEDSSTRKRPEVRKDSARHQNVNAELAAMAMAEIYLRLDYESDTRLKEGRTGVKKSGRVANLFYLSVTDGNFNFYNNLVRVPALSAAAFLSPVSYSGLLAYKFKTVQITPRRGHKLYTVSVKPRQLSNATVSGELTVSDSAWVIEHTRFQFPKYHLPEYDFFEVEQRYEVVNNQAWMLNEQRFRYNSKSKTGKLSGTTLVTYSNYELQKKFGKGHFGTEVSGATAEAYERDSTFWQTVRTVPLTPKEVRYIQYRDSVYNATSTLR